MANQLLMDIQAQTPADQGAMTTTNRLLNDIQSRGGQISLTPSTVTQQPEKKSFWTKAKEAFGRRKDTLSEGYLRQMQGKQSFIESAAQTVGETIGLSGDLLAEGAVSAWQKITPDFIEGPLTDAAKMLGSSMFNTPIGDQAKSALLGGATAWQNFATQHPRAADNIRATLNIASVLPITRIARGAKPLFQETFAPAIREIGAGVKTIAKGTGEALETAGKYGLKQVTGLSDDTIKAAIEFPEALTRAEIGAASRESLGTRIFSAVTKRLSDLADLGREYNVIRQLPETSKVVLPKKFFTKTLAERFGISFDRATGQIVRTAESIPLTTSDVNKLQDFLSIYGKENVLSGNSFLNAREALTQIADFDREATTAAKKIARSLRQELNTFRDQIPKLKELDLKFAPERQLMKEIRKDFFTRQGTLKENALSKLANLTPDKKPLVLSRIKEVVPDIEDQLKILRAIEDIKAASSFKVGTYMKSFGMVGGGAVAGGIPGALAGAMLSNPYLAIFLLRQYGMAKRALQPLINRLITKMKNGIKLTTAELQVLNQAVDEMSEKLKQTAARANAGLSKRAGLTIEDVSQVKPAKKYKSALEAMQDPVYKARMDEFRKSRGKVTKTSNNLYHTTSLENIDSIIENGLQTGRKARFDGVSSPNKISFSANEAGAKYYGGNNDVMIRTKTSYKPDDLDFDLLAGGEGTYTTGKNIPPEMLEIKVGNKWIDLGDYKLTSKNLKPTKTKVELPPLENISDKKAFAEELGFKIDKITLDGAEDFWAKKSKPNQYYHIGTKKITEFDKSKSRYDPVTRGGGISQINGMYLGRDAEALKNFYGMVIKDEIGKTPVISSFKISPKWLDLSRKADETKFLKEVAKKYGIKQGRTAEFGDALEKEIIDRGYDGVRYFDPYATGEEFILVKKPGKK